MKKISLVSPLKNEARLLDRGLKELEAFIQRFPLKWEIVLAIDPSQDETLAKAQALKSEKIEIQILQMPSAKGRGPSLKQALQAATGDYVMIFPLDFTIPLADLFNFLQELVLNPEVDLVIGNRNTSRKKHEAPARTTWHWTLEKIISEKLSANPSSAQWKFQDPLCPYLIFQKASLQKLLPQLKMKSWYYTPEVLKAATAMNFKIVEAPILSRDSRPSQIPLLKEYFRNLF
jgi:glycosyltransferase involved in cell wall biosynthesis